MKLRLIEVEVGGGGGGGGGGFLVITVSHPTFCCVVLGLGFVVEVGLDCDNNLEMS